MGPEKGLLTTASDYYKNLMGTVVPSKDETSDSTAAMTSTYLPAALLVGGLAACKYALGHRDSTQNDSSPTTKSLSRAIKRIKKSEPNQVPILSSTYGCVFLLLIIIILIGLYCYSTRSHGNSQPRDDIEMGYSGGRRFSLRGRHRFGTPAANRRHGFQIPP